MSDREANSNMLSNTVSRRIEWGDCDPAGIVFNPRFFAFFDHCTTMLYEAAGWPKQAMVEKFGIVGCPLVETRAKFLSPCSYGDEVSITSTVADLRNSSFDIRHTLSRDGTPCVEGFETRVWTRRDLETGRLRSTPLPPEVVARFQGK
jgi:4-hydroxybenzoyl-CoA thioesterase